MATPNDQVIPEENTAGNLEGNPENNTQEEEKEEKYINPDLFNDDPEESLKMEKLAIEAKPYFSSSILPKSLYLQRNVLPLVYEALAQVEKIRPKDPIEFFAVYLLDKNNEALKDSNGKVIEFYSEDANEVMNYLNSNDKVYNYLIYDDKGVLDLEKSKENYENSKHKGWGDLWVDGDLSKKGDKKKWKNNIVKRVVLNDFLQF